MRDEKKGLDNNNNNNSRNNNKRRRTSGGVVSVMFTKSLIGLTVFFKTFCRHFAYKFQSYRVL